MNEVLATKTRGDGRLLRSVLGDITTEAVDALVNAANTRLSHGGGVAGAISAAGGPSIQSESNRIKPVPTGSARATGAGTLKARYVIHAVGPIWSGGDADEVVLLGAAVCSALDVAAELELATVSIPAISTGVFGFPLDAAIQIIHLAVTGWLDARPDASLREIRYCNILPDVAVKFATLL
jgi:putative ATPase